MALEAVVFPQDLFIQNSRECYSMAGGPWFHDFNGGLVEEEENNKVMAPECAVSVGGDGAGGSMEMYNEQEKGSFFDDLHASWDPSCSSLVQNFDDWDANSSPETRIDDGSVVATAAAVVTAATTAGGRRKRRRTKTCKNKEEVENQRMTHIAVERNRRKQMNEYLAVLRSLMPASYVQRGDQASIIGGAINFVKELEQLLQSLEAQKRIKQRSPAGAPFSDFFTFPQYSTCARTSSSSAAGNSSNEAVAENRSAIADIEVTMVESHANLKILSRRRPKQLLKIVVGLQNHHLTALHLNVTTIDQMVLYSFSLKVEDDCQLTSVDEIATAVYQMLGRIQEESGFDHQMNTGC